MVNHHILRTHHRNCDGIKYSGEVSESGEKMYDTNAVSIFLTRVDRCGITYINIFVSGNLSVNLCAIDFFFIYRWLILQTHWAISELENIPDSRDLCLNIHPTSNTFLLNKPKFKLFLIFFWVKLISVHVHTTDSRASNVLEACRFQRQPHTIRGCPYIKWPLRGGCSSVNTVAGSQPKPHRVNHPFEGFAWPAALHHIQD